MRIVAIVNQKGGCGKTTVSINLASALAELGQRTLLVDMDPQSHCAVGLAVPEEQIEQSIYDVLISNSSNEPVKLNEILWQICDNLDLAPSSIDLSAFGQQMTGLSNREIALKEVLEKVRKDFDYCIIDCPPAVGILTFNALHTATDVIIPVETGYFSLHGLSKQLDTLNILRDRANQNINVGVVASMYDIRTKMAREVLSELRSHFGDKMFKTVINFNTKLKEAASFGQPISEFDPSSKGRLDFQQLAKELMDSSVQEQRHDMVNSLTDQLEAISSTVDELVKEVNDSPNTDALKTQPESDNNINIGIEPELVSQRDEQNEFAKSSTIDEKLSDYYGVNQEDGSIVFITLYPRAQNVQIAGDFNGWQPEKTYMEKIGDTGIWQTKIKLPSGKYKYRFVVDGQWQQDPYNDTTEINPFGEYNSIFMVK